jgi:hypothetical protein
MTIIAEGDLSWPLADDLFNPPDDLDIDLVATAQAIAIEWLWELTARQFGTFPAVYRPQTRVLSVYDYPYGLQSIYGPLWSLGWPFTGDPRENGLGLKQFVELVAPVVSIQQVDIYDVTTGAHTVMLPTDSPPLFRQEGNYLVRQDGGQWPDTQNLIAALGAINTWAVTYTRGVVPPTMGQVAAALLAQEFAKQFAGDKACKVPANATTVTRAGVTVNRDILKAMKTTGIDIVDKWVTMVNPNGLQQSPQFWSPDQARNAPTFAGSYAPTS